MFTEHDLKQFYGTEQWYRHWTRRLIYTDGIQFLVEHGAAWLVDAIASHQTHPALQKGLLHDYQLWELQVNLGNRTAVLTCRADTDAKPVIEQKIEFTDFPLDHITLYVERGEELTLLLPSER
jgi:hypothetical protein